MMKKYLLILLTIISLASCGPSMKLSVPTQFSEQAEKMEVKGARSRHISFGNFSSSRIKRGMNVSYPGWGKGFFFENLLLNQVGVQKNEIVDKQKDRFSFELSDGSTIAQVYAKERAVTKSLRYSFAKGMLPINEYNRLQQYQYVFSAVIKTDTATNSRPWELLMTNIYDRKQDTVNSLFTILKPGDDGFASNGIDTIRIISLDLKQTEAPNGKKAWLPFKLLSGFELRIDDGVIAVIDAIDKNVWFYKELDKQTRLTVAAISTAIFARRVKDVKW